MRKITMAEPFFSVQDREIIHREIDLILSGPLSMGPHVKSFENEFAARIGSKYAIAMNSCTATLEAALIAKGAVGREVIVPSETFIATAMAVHLIGGIPVFAEISESTLCLDLDDVKRRITPRTAGVILVHFAGRMTEDIASFREFCDANNLFLIEDAAHAPGAQLNGQEAGTFGHIGCFSFYPTKVLTSGEGGMLTTDDEQVAAFARSYQNRGKDMTAIDETYISAGRNVRMTEISALVGRVQLSHLDEFLKRRRVIASSYSQILSKYEQIELILPKEIEQSSYWKIPIVLGPKIDRHEVTNRMLEEGISVDWTYAPAVHLQPIFRKLYGTSPGLLPITERVLSRHLCLPCHPRMSDEDVKFVGETLMQIVDELYMSSK
jgi:dTDP-4-amino-4,6-dideoxygalactose transaminase